MTLLELVKELDPKRSQSELKAIENIFSKFIPDKHLKDLDESIVSKIRKFKFLLNKAGIK